MRNSREHILSVLKELQIPVKPLDPYIRVHESGDTVSTFAEMLKAVGGIAYRVKTPEEAERILRKDLAGAGRTISTIPDFFQTEEADGTCSDPSSLHDVDLFILRASLAVAENGAVWVHAGEIPHCVLPFICRHLAVVVDGKNIVSTMHEAYREIGDQGYGYACFIAGPSKTADIEQSLVMGAHGAVSMRVFIVGEEKEP